MAGNKKVTDLRRKSRFNALRILSQHEGLPVPPRKAISQARKATKERGYPVAPYPNANPIQLYNWGKQEWSKLGKWQSLAGPVAVIVGLLTWQKEKKVQEEYQAQSDKARSKMLAARTLYRSERPKKKRKLLGFIPLPSR